VDDEQVRQAVRVRAAREQPLAGGARHADLYDRANGDVLRGSVYGLETADARRAGIALRAFRSRVALDPLHALESLVALRALDARVALRPLRAAVALGALRARLQLAGLEVGGQQGAICDLRAGDGVRGQLRARDGLGGELLARDGVLLQLGRADRVFRQHEPAGRLAERRRAEHRHDESGDGDDRGEFRLQHALAPLRGCASKVAAQAARGNTASLRLEVWPAEPGGVRHTPRHAPRAVR